MTVPATHPALPAVFVNGTLTAADAASISPRDRGFTLADGLFETMRARDGVIFRLDRHLSRLSDGLRVMQIPPPPELRDWMVLALTHGGNRELSVRLTVSRGSGPGGLAPPTDVRPTTVITVAPMPHASPEIYAQGLRAIVASGRRNSRAMSVGLKTLAYTDSVLAWIEAQRAGADEALLLDTEGHVSEAAASNVFACRGGVLVTPPLSCAALPGITRATTLELAAELGIEAAEQLIEVPDLATADEVFLTSSLRGIAPVRTIDGRPVGSGAPGPVTTRIAAAYEALLVRECGPA
jgi:branched-chain amino acid aminotransferase